MRVKVLTVGVMVAACGVVPQEPLGVPLITPDAGPARVIDSGVSLPHWRAEDDAERLAAAECAWQRRCAPALFERGGGSETACRLAVRARRSEVLIRRGQLAADDRMVFDREAFERCLGDLARDCTPVRCDEAFVGVVPLGDACGDSDECAGADTYCTGEPHAACGLCARQKNGFASCGIDVECQSQRCTQRCLPPVAVGELCEKNCTFGLCCPGSCVGPGQGTGTCRRAAARGEVCDPSASSAPRCDAALGLHCRAGMCVPVEVVGVDADCDATTWCDEGASCLDGRCRPWPRSGEACVDLCRGDDVCRDGHCQPSPQAGDRCLLDAHCAPLLWCRGEGDRECGDRAWVDCR